MIVYIAGRITNQFDFMKRFRKVERYLKSQGHTTINPARLTQGLNDYTQICNALIDQADAVYFLHDWNQSEGATIEHQYALQNNKILIFEGSLESISEDGKLSEEEFWHMEALKAVAQLGEIKIKIAEAAEKAGVING